MFFLNVHCVLVSTSMNDKIYGENVGVRKKKRNCLMQSLFKKMTEKKREFLLLGV